MDYKTVKKNAPGRGEVEVLAETYETGYFCISFE